MYDQLKKFHQRPEVFSIYSAEKLWTEPHLANQMLQYHLNPETELASRPQEAIDRVVNWIERTFGLDGARVCDLGCGPGLYANQYAKRGAIVHGLDFSHNSIDYARKYAPSHAGPVTYRVANYLTDPLPGHQDLVTLIYCDLCPLSPAQRQMLLAKIRHSLAPQGIFICDVLSTKAFENVREGVAFGRNFMNGFWSAQDYFAFQHTFRYEDEAVSLERYCVIEKDQTWDVFNWLQYFTPDDICADLKQAGFGTVEITEGFGMDVLDETTFGVVARL